MNQTLPIETIHCAIAIIGGSLGGCAAALELVREEKAWALIHPNDWLGGQMTEQGVSALDEHAHIETFGAPQGYLRMRQVIRQHYVETYNVSDMMETSVLGANMPLNPGNGWVSRLCFEPIVAVAYLDAEFAAARHLYREARLVQATMNGTTIESVTLQLPDRQVCIYATLFLDATDTGDLLPLTHTPYITGAEAHGDTGEPHAPPTAQPHEVQSFTYCFAVEFCTGENHTIDKPAGYEAFRDTQPYTLAPLARDGSPVVYRMFAPNHENLPFWSYRRIYDGALLGGNDIALINWVSNDYYQRDILEVTEEERAQSLDEAKRLSLGFLYWLQTECPRDNGGVGYPEMKLRPDVMGTMDGLSKAPYIRESRRIVARTRIVEQDIVAAFHQGARSRHYEDSVGIGSYSMDLHPCVGNPNASHYAPTKPFQIPLGALLSTTTTNLIAACKNIGTTHLTNGAYRLHPIEWAIGAAAAVLANYCFDHQVSPQEVVEDRWHVWCLQYHLVERGCPIVWAVDVPHTHALFIPTQLLLVRDLIVPESSRWHRLDIGLDEPLGDSISLHKVHHLIDDIQERCRKKFMDSASINADTTWSGLCQQVHPILTYSLP
jgi:hypothetical protein